MSVLVQGSLFFGLDVFSVIFVGFVCYAVREEGSVEILKRAGKMGTVSLIL